MPADAAQREEIVAIQAGVTHFHAHPALGHCRVGHRADLQGGKRFIGSCVCGVNGEHRRPPFGSGDESRDDFKRRDLVAFELEEEPKINGTAGKVAGEPACDDRPSVRLSHANGSHVY
jgi:hypothetical protein